MRVPVTGIAALASIIFVSGMARTIAAQPQLHDYLSNEEAGKIRDADTPSLRIKLYISFAEDRLKKFDYELNRTAPERNRDEILNGLLNGYEGCMDDASDEIADARRKQMDIREALKFMDSKAKLFLAQLQKFAKGAPGLEDHRDTLQDAIDSTNDALSSVSDAQKNMLPAPVRRKP